MNGNGGIEGIATLFHDGSSHQTGQRMGRGYSSFSKGLLFDYRILKGVYLGMIFEKGSILGNQRHRKEKKTQQKANARGRFHQQQEEFCWRGGHTTLP